MSCIIIIITIIIISVRKGGWQVPRDSPAPPCGSGGFPA